MENKFRFRVLGDNLKYVAQISAAVVALVSIGKTIHESVFVDVSQVNIVRWVQFVSVMSSKNPAASIRAAEELWIVLKLDRMAKEDVIIYEDIVRAKFPGREIKLKRYTNAKV